MTDVQFRTKDAFGYFRMGLVTGLVDRQALVEWADAHIVRSATPDHAVIELSLAGNRPYSQIIRLLTGFERAADYSLSLKLLLARAGALLEQDPGRAVDIIMGLRLLNEEEYFPKDMKSQIAHLVDQLAAHRANTLSAEDLVAALSGFLAQYADYRPLLPRTVCPPFGNDGG